MCYSANASFAAAAVLTVMSGFLLTRVKNKRFVPLALIPLFFAMQQAAEGLLWLGIVPTFAKSFFLFFAFIVWPLWVPFSFWLVEEKKESRQILAACFGIGVVISTLLSLTIPQITVSTAFSSILYFYPDHFYKPDILLVFYGCATLLPFFVSSLPRTCLFGFLFAASALLILWVDRTFFVSLWCFVSALISCGLFFILRSSRNFAQK